MEHSAQSSSVLARVNRHARKALPWMWAALAVLVIFVWAIPKEPKPVATPVVVPAAPSREQKRAAYDIYAKSIKVMLAASYIRDGKVMAVLRKDPSMRGPEIYGALRDAQMLNEGLMMKAMTELTPPAVLQGYRRQLDDIDDKIGTVFSVRAAAYEQAAAFVDERKPSQEHKMNEGIQTSDRYRAEVLKVMDGIAAELKQPEIAKP